MAPTNPLMMPSNTFHLFCISYHIFTLLMMICSFLLHRKNSTYTQAKIKVFALQLGVLLL